MFFKRGKNEFGISSDASTSGLIESTEEIQGEDLLPTDEEEINLLVNKYINYHYWDHSRLIEEELNKYSLNDLQLLSRGFFGFIASLEKLSEDYDVPEYRKEIFGGLLIQGSSIMTDTLSGELIHELREKERANDFDKEQK